MIFRIRHYPTGGGHVRCKLYVAPGPRRTFAACGEFTLRKGAEFDALKQAFQAEFIDEMGDLRHSLAEALAQLEEARDAPEKIGG